MFVMYVVDRAVDWLAMLNANKVERFLRLLFSFAQFDWNLDEEREMVKSYLRHGGTEAFGLVASSSSNSLFDGRRAFVPALEDVLVWDVKKGEQVSRSLHYSSPTERRS